MVTTLQRLLAMQVRAARLPESVIDLARKHRELAGRQYQLENARDNATMDIEGETIDTQEEMLRKLQGKLKDRDALYSILMGKGVDRKSSKYKEAYNKRRSLEREMAGISSPYEAKINRVYREKYDLERPYNKKIDSIHRAIARLHKRVIKG